LINFEPVYRLESRSTVRGFWDSGDSTTNNNNNKML